VQDGDEHRALDREVEAAATQEVGEHVGDPEPHPQPAEEERAADAGAGETPGLHVGKDHRPLAVAGERGDQPVQFAARQQHILAPERPDDLLPDPSAVAHALDQIQIAVAAGRLLAHEHARCCS
jgi:hypothetical protein